MTARPFYTFGPGQTTRAVIPTIASHLISGKKEIKLGTLHPSRDFNFATDTARGMVALALFPAAEGQVINIGSGEEWSIAKTLELLCEITGGITGGNPCIITDNERIRAEKSEVNRLLADNTKIS